MNSSLLILPTIKAYSISKCGSIWASWLIAIGTIILAIVALFKDDIRYFFYKPKIELICSNLPPYKKIINNNVWFKLKIKNKGNITAKNCYVKIAQITNQNLDPISDFEPFDLNWSRIYKPIKNENIAPGSSSSMLFMFFNEKFDQGFKRLIFIDKYGEKVWQDIKKDNYKFYVFICGDNFKPVRNIVELNTFTNEIKKIATY